MSTSDKAWATVSALCLVFILGVWVVKIPSTQEVFAQAKAQEVANGR